MKTLFSDFNFSNLSSRRINYFWGIEEIQSFYFLNIINFFKIEYFIDIGANIGAYSLLASTINSIKFIYAFEPTPSTFNELKSNTSFMGNIELFNLALSDSKDNCLFADFGNYSGKNSIINTSIHNTANANCIEICSDLLDDIIEFKNSNIFIKIDVEGNEYNVLKGGINFITSNNSIVQIEHGHRNKDKAWNLLINNNFKNILNLGPDSYFINYNVSINDLYRVLSLSLNELISYRWKS